MTHIEKHIARVEEWAEQRGLYETDSPIVQYGKMVEELGELIMSIGKDDIEGIKDAIGDVRVCLINVCRLAGVPFTEVDSLPSEEIEIGWLLLEVSRICTYRSSYKELKVAIANTNSNLSSIANAHGFTLKECDNHAWGQIKDRTGKTVGGEFVKDA